MPMVEGPWLEPFGVFLEASMLFLEDNLHKQGPKGRTHRFICTLSTCTLCGRKEVKCPLSQTVVDFTAF